MAVYSPRKIYTDLEHAPPLHLDHLEKEIHNLVNTVREDHGLAPLVWHDTLAAIARGHSNDMAERIFFDHTNPDGEDSSARALRNDYSCLKQLDVGLRSIGIAENLMSLSRYDSYYSTETEGVVTVFYSWKNVNDIAAEVVNSWLNSPSHRDNLLMERFDREGIGVALTSDQQLLVTQNMC